MRLIYNYTITTIACSMIQKGRVDGILRPKSTSYLITTWVMGGIVDGMRPISTYPITINTFSITTRGVVSSPLVPISTSSIFTAFITTTINSNIVIVIVTGLWRNKSTSSITYKHTRTSIIINLISVTIVGGRMSGLLGPISKISVTTYTQPFIAVHI